MTSNETRCRVIGRYYAGVTRDVDGDGLLRFFCSDTAFFVRPEGDFEFKTAFEV